MKIVMVSNYLNHHQLPLCEAFLRQGVEFTFVATEPLADYRRDMGYADLNHSCSFVINAYESNEKEKLAFIACGICDILILGEWDIRYKKCAKPDCIIFKYSERIFKGSAFGPKNIIRFFKYFFKYDFSRNAFLLCSGAYAARDYRLLGQYSERAYKWGYFPQVKAQDAESLIAGKDPVSIVWAARFLPLKHPETVIHVAERLQRDGIPFKVSMIGDGVVRQKMEALVADKGLEKSVLFLGALSPDAVRRQMESSQIYLFTSDRREGWGAVLNESMNSCCIVIANDEVGSVPYLIEDGVNGFIYPHGDEEVLYRRLKAVLTGRIANRKIALAANETMQTMWNPDTAAERLLVLAKALAEGKDTPFESGVCSKA